MNPGEQVQPAIPQGSVIITPSDMYKEMQDIGKKVDHLTAVVDPAFAQVRTDVAYNRSEIEKHEIRLNKTENQLSWIKGIGSVLALALSSGVVTLIVEVFHSSGK